MIVWNSPQQILNEFDARRGRGPAVGESSAGQGWAATAPTVDPNGIGPHTGVTVAEIVSDRFVNVEATIGETLSRITKPH